ncbi:UbiD family decarboxylase [Gimesia sp.]|uniref:UbiD family decarboxylase n=1 Tax=Gimesia sp. TaxID=2024833 RepID=UPI000C39211D|nr:UbiD family decarboxylase [Gimesia sp.]MAX35021.1 3-octaprenyl-4-hydroxybenzoate carboxy-lyase [Gimesia sp.]|tara:strand:- start:5537 stop:7366 length:1830 start_codon:yes stop_codon:yes gene_type:complete
MGYRGLRACVNDLERTGQLIRIEQEIDAHLEAAEIQRRVYQAGGPAVFFPHVKDCRFPMVSNLFGTLERTRYIFRDALQAVNHLVELKVDPSRFWKQPFRYRDVPFSLLHMLPRSRRTGPVMQNQIRISDLPQLKSWPDDGGAFVTLPQVYTESPTRGGLMNSNLGMYRIQLSGNEYQPDQQIGMHYQIHRSIGVHHAEAIEKGEPLKVNIFVGGSPAMTLSAVMPLPEGLSELTFAGALSKRAIRMVRNKNGLPIYADADFCITGWIDPEKLLPEGPFGDHLGYYSLAHPFPVMNVEAVYHRNDAIWPFTVVGRPPQEDTAFGAIIHEITGPAIPSVIPGVHQVHAVDAAGVHPLLLAIGSERYTPYDQERKPQEILTNANAILGQGQLSLAKYLMIVAREDRPDLDAEELEEFLSHLLERIDWKRDLHFQTCTTIDTLDYSGTGFNSGSKVVMAAAGPKKRTLLTQIPPDCSLPDGFSQPRLCRPGIVAIKAPAFQNQNQDLRRFSSELPASHSLNQFPLIVLVDDSEFTAASLNNFLWTVFTRSNPASDLDGVDAFTENKHWGCRGALVIDARIKPWHAPPLIEDPDITRRVDQLGAPGGPLHGII